MKNKKTENDQKNVIFVHGIEFLTFTEKGREIGDRPKFALSVLKRSVSQHFLRRLNIKNSRDILSILAWW